MPPCRTIARKTGTLDRFDSNSFSRFGLSVPFFRNNSSGNLPMLFDA
jgi:hypothetical protein